MQSKKLDKRMPNRKGKTIKVYLGCVELPSRTLALGNIESMFELNKEILEKFPSSATLHQLDKNALILKDNYVDGPSADVYAYYVKMGDGEYVLNKLDLEFGWAKHSSIQEVKDIHEMFEIV